MPPIPTSMDIEFSRWWGGRLRQRETEELSRIAFEAGFRAATPLILTSPTEDRTIVRIESALER